MAFHSIERMSEAYNSAFTKSKGFAKKVQLPQEDAPGMFDVNTQLF